MALKVVSSKPATTGLKVVRNYTGLGTSTYNPQKTVSPQVTYNPQRATYNPQKTTSPQKAATAAQVAAVTQAQFRAAALAQQQAADRARIAAETAKRNAQQAKATEINTKKQGFLGKLADKVTFGQTRRERAGREKAAKYYKENEAEWGALLDAKKRTYELKGASLQNWIFQATSYEDEEYRKRVATDYLKKEAQSYNKDVENFIKSQKGLSVYSAKPLTGKLSTGARVFKNATNKVFGTTFNALTWTASQPQRAVNTAKNFVNPNNLRQYYGGKEVKNGKDIVGKGSNPLSKSWDQLRKSYNVSRNQRTVGFSKADESARLKGWSGKVKVDGKDRFVTKKPSGIDRFRIKYGDDIADMALDPMNYFAGIGAASKVGKSSLMTKALKQFQLGKNKFSDLTLKQAGKSKFLSDALISREARKGMKEDSWIKWLKANKFDHNQAKYPDFYDNRVPAYKQAINKSFEQADKFRNEVINPHWTKFKAAQAEKAAHKQAWASGYKTLDNYDTSWTRTLKNLAKHNPDQADALQKYISTIRQADGKAPYVLKKANSFDGLDDLAKTLSEKQRRKVMVRAWRMENTYKKLYKDDIANINRQIKALARDSSPYAVKKRKELEKRLYQQKQGYFSKTVSKSPIVNLGKPKGKTFDPYYTKQQKTWKHQKPEAFAASQSKRVWSQIIDQEPSIGDMLSESKRINWKITDSYKRAKGADATPFLQNKYKVGKDRIFKQNIDKVTTPFERLTGNKLIAPKPTKIERFERKLNKAEKYNYPMRAWNASVLPLNPAWYVNNVGTNIPQSISAGGWGVVPETMKLLRNKNYKQALAEAPDGVVSNIEQLGKQSKLFKPATRIENTSRLAAFRELKKKGFSDERAKKIVNTNLYDYAGKNIERPIEAVMPFWQWSKNLLRTGTTLPFTSPRTAKVYSEAYRAGFERPYDALPNYEQTYTDKNTGETTTFNPKEFYKGKAKIGDTWYGLPFFATNPENMTNIGLNPYLTAGADYMTSSDKYGRPNTDRSSLSILGERFPQVKLTSAYLKRKVEETRTWFTKQGASKQSQGYDSSKPNYDKNLDNNLKFQNALKSFVGIPRGVKFDKKEMDTKFKLTQFNQDYFKRDWDKRLEQLKDETGDQYFGFDDPRSPYNRLRKEQQALAKKYGFDLQKDIYDKYWSKYDTATTKNTKRLKEQAFEFNRSFWRDYLSKSAGSRTQASQRRPFLISKYDEWRRNNTFADNVYKKIPEFSVYDQFGNKTNVKKSKNSFTLKAEQASSEAKRAQGAAKYARKLAYDKAKKTGDWSYFNKNFGNSRKSSPFTADGKYFKSAASRQKYLAGKAKYEAGKARYAAGKAKADLWSQYYKLNSTAERKAFLAKHPSLATYKTPTTQAEWDALRFTIRQKNRAKISKLPNFTTAHANAKADIQKRVQGFQPFGKTKRVRYKA